MSLRNRVRTYRPWEDYLPPAFRAWLKERFHGSLLRDPTIAVKYMPARAGTNSYVVGQEKVAVAEDQGFPVPPPELWLGYGGSVEEFLAGGQEHVARMRAILAQSGYTLAPGQRVLDFGCAAARMTRHLIPEAQQCEIWGCDIQGDAMLWCKTHLSPPLNFLTNTTIPHLPFEDRFFHLIYAGSVFTHIEDLAEAWLQELRRLLAPGGRMFLTIHDRNSIEALETLHPDSPTAKLFHAYRLYRERRHDHRLLVIGRDRRSHVFYDLDYFTQTVARTLEVVSVVPQGYGFQTAVVLTRRDG